MGSASVPYFVVQILLVSAFRQCRTREISSCIYAIIMGVSMSSFIYKRVRDVHAEQEIICMTYGRVQTPREGTKVSDHRGSCSRHSLPTVVVVRHRTALYEHLSTHPFDIRCTKKLQQISHPRGNVRTAKRATARK